MTLLCGAGIRVMWGREAEEKPAVRCRLPRVDTSGARLLSWVRR